MTDFVNGSPGFVGAPHCKNLLGEDINWNKLRVGERVLLRQGFWNVSSAHRIPNNTIQPFIDIGPYMKMVSVEDGEMSKYFDFRQDFTNEAYVIVATQKAGIEADIPPDFFGMFSFVVEPIKEGVSNFQSNINILNTNPDSKTTDPVDQDNYSNSQYTVLPPLPNKPNPERVKALESTKFLFEKGLMTKWERERVDKRTKKKLSEYL